MNTTTLPPQRACSHGKYAGLSRQENGKGQAERLGRESEPGQSGPYLKNLAAMYEAQQAANETSRIKEKQIQKEFRQGKPMLCGSGPNPVGDAGPEQGHTLSVCTAACVAAAMQFSCT